MKILLEWLIFSIQCEFILRLNSFEFLSRMTFENVSCWDGWNKLGASVCTNAIVEIFEHVLSILTIDHPHHHLRACTRHRRLRRYLRRCRCRSPHCRSSRTSHRCRRVCQSTRPPLRLPSHLSRPLRPRVRRHVATVVLFVQANAGLLMWQREKVFQGLKTVQSSTLNPNIYIIVSRDQSMCLHAHAHARQSETAATHESELYF